MLKFLCIKWVFVFVVINKFKICFFFVLFLVVIFFIVKVIGYM